MKFSVLLQSASKYLQNPELFNLRRQGVTASQYGRYGRRWIRDIAPVSIFDIGANTGQSAVAFHALFPTANIFCFEPIPDCFKALSLRISGIPNIQAFNVGLGDFVGESEFKLNEFNASSSFLPLTDIHKDLFTYAQKTETIQVHVDKLDNFESKLKLAQPILIKIDVQGFEDQVLKGGENIVRKSSVLIIETSFKPLYCDQPLFKDIYAILQGWGFEYVGSVENTCDPVTNEIIQADAVFAKIDEKVSTS